MERLAKRVGMLTLGVVGLLPGCKQEDFRCGDDSECKIETIQGFCEFNSYCSFPAADCESARRYGAQAGDGLAGVCVPTTEAGSTTDVSTVGSASSTTEPDLPQSSSATGQGSTTDQPTGPDSTSSSSQGVTSGSGGSESTTGAPVDMWSDDFDRPDSPDLGNGWIERSPGTFALARGRVVFDDVPMAYQDSVFYRPFEEALLNLEVSIEFTHVGDFNFSTPQLHTRIQEDSLGMEPLSLNAYIVYLSQPDRIDISRVEGDSFALNNSEPIDPPLPEGQTHRLSLRVTGTDPVELFGMVEGLVDGAWTPIQTVELIDNDPTRITDPGSFGASGSQSVTFEYDNFTVVADP